MSIVVVDVESDGSIPPNYSMICASIDTELAEIREISKVLGANAPTRVR